MPMVDPNLCCPQRHTIRKYKRLKPWQDILQSGKYCGICLAEIGRHDFRWRCEEHCDYNICELCYDDHWMNVIQEAARTEKPKPRWRLINSIPRHLRESPDFKALVQWTPGQATPKAQQHGADNGAGAFPPGDEAQDNKGAKDVRMNRRVSFAGEAETIDPEKPDICSDVKWYLVTLQWLALWACSSSLVLASIKSLNERDDFEFPNMWLVLGATHIATFFVCQCVVASAQNSPAVTLGEPINWKIGGSFGILHCIQLGVEYSSFRSVTFSAYSTAGAVVLPGLFLLGELFLEMEQCRRSLLASLALCAVAAILINYGGGGLFEHPVKGVWALIEGMLMELVAGVLAAARLAMSQQVLKQQDWISPLIFGTRMAPGTIVVGLLLATVLYSQDYSFFRDIFRTESWEEVTYHLCGVGVCFGVSLVAELHIIQRCSAMLVGLLGPCQGLLILIVSAMLSGSQVPDTVFIGIFPWLGAIGVYAYAKSRDGPHKDVGEASDHYKRLAGEARKRSTRAKAAMHHARPVDWI